MGCPALFDRHFGRLKFLVQHFDGFDLCCCGMAPNTTTGTTESIVTNRQQNKNQNNRTSTITVVRKKIITHRKTKMFFPSLSFLVPMIQNDDQCLILPKSVCRRPAGTRTMYGCGCPWRSTTRTPTRPTQTPTVLNAPTVPLDGAMFVACTPHLPQRWHTVDRVDRFDRSYWSLNIKKKTTFKNAY